MQVNYLFRRSDLFWYRFYYVVLIAFCSISKAFKEIVILLCVALFDVFYVQVRHKYDINLKRSDCS